MAVESLAVPTARPFQLGDRVRVVRTGQCHKPVPGDPAFGHLAVEEGQLGRVVDPPPGFTRWPSAATHPICVVYDTPIRVTHPQGAIWHVHGSNYAPEELDLVDVTSDTEGLV